MLYFALLHMHAFLTSQALIICKILIQSYADLPKADTFHYSYQKTVANITTDSHMKNLNY